MDFEEQLRQAVERGKRKNARSEAEALSKAMTEEDRKRLHTKYRLEISDHIDACVSRLADHFPGFESEIVFGEKGWGAAIARDDLHLARGERSSRRSRFEVTVRPYTDYHVLDVAAKGTINNKELFQRQYFESIEDVVLQQFLDRIDHWVLEYAELYASKL